MAVSAVWWALMHSGQDAGLHGKVTVFGLKSLAVLEHLDEAVLQKVFSATLKAD